jgi:hypothetical protein
LSGILVQEVENVRAVFRTHSPTAHLDSRTLGEWADLLVRI